MATEAERLASLLDGALRRISELETTEQIARSTIDVDGEPVEVPDVASSATEAAEAIPGLDEDLDAARDDLLVNADTVAVALEAAEDAREAGLAAAEEAAAAADEALAAAQVARDNAAEALGSATHAVVLVGNASEDAQAKADAAQAAAIAPAAADAHAKADAARAAAVAAAATDAQTKADSAKAAATTAATSAAATDAQAKADAAQAAAISAAATAAQSKADAAKAAAISAAASDASSKANAAQAAAIAAAAADATTKADAAKAAGLAAAATAQKSADGKATVTYANVVPPSGQPGKAGDLWFVVPDTKTGVVTAQYRHDGSTFVVQTLDSAVVASLDAGKITAGLLSADRIAGSTITGAKIAADTLTGREIAADAISAAELAADAVLARNIKAGVITAGHLSAATITGDKIAAGTIATGNLAAGAVTADKITAGAITAEKLSVGALDGKTITGATVQTGASGKRAVLGGTRVDFYATDPVKDPDGTVIYDGYAGRIEAASNGAQSNSGAVYVGSGDGLGMTFGKSYLPVAGTVGATAPSAYVNELYVDHIYSSQTNSLVGGSDTGWRSVPMLSGFASDPNRPAQYRKIGGTVYFRGQVNKTSGNITSGDGSMFRMPSGYRPPAVWYFVPSAGSAGAVARFRVLDTGEGGISAISGAATYAQLDGLFYLLD